MSKYIFLFNAKLSAFSAGENKWHFNEMMMMSAISLDKILTNTQYPHMCHNLEQDDIAQKAR